MGILSIDGYEPAHLSHSTVDGYRTCGMRHRLQKILRVEQRPMLAGMGGNAVHSATEKVDLGEYDAAVWPVADLFRECWDEEVGRRQKDSPNFRYPEDYILTGKAAAQYGGKRNVDWWMDNGPLMVQRWIDWRAEHGWQIWETPEGNPAIELELNIVLPGDIPVKMFIDRLMVTPHGQLVPVDIKTGRSPETPEQLGLYATAVGMTWGEMFHSDWGYFWDAQKGTHGQPQELSRYTAEYFAEVYGQAVRGIQAGCFLAKPANGCSRWCGVSAYCPAVGGTLPSSV